MSPHIRLPRGGIIAMLFIIGNEAFERVATYGRSNNMIVYFTEDYRMGLATGANMFFYWNAATCVVRIIGAFVAGSYLGRFLTIGLGSLCSLLGIVLLWLITMIPQFKPPPCDQTTVCKSSTSAQLAVLAFSLAFISIGDGVISSCSLAFGADQLDKRENPKNKRILESYFGWYYASAATSHLIASTMIFYIQDHIGWKVGFGVSAILMFFSAFLFLLASPLYIKIKAGNSLFAGFAHVIVASYKNRKLALPPRNADGWYRRKDSEHIMPTEKLRFLNKACIIRSPEQDIKPDGLAANPWSLCTIDQVEELKALAKVIPLWSSCIMTSINTRQVFFQLEQAKSMDRHINSNFQIPLGSIRLFGITSLIIWVILYDRAILPIASKIKGKPVRLGTKLKMWIGIFLSCMAMVVSAIVENVRRRRAMDQGLLDNVVVNMSVMWLVPQLCLNGLAEAFNAVGQTEFYYFELPKSMSSIASSLFGLGMTVANVLNSLMLSTVGDVTSRGGKESWVSSNISKGHYENYYWLLAIMNFINLLYFMVCSWAYGPCDEKVELECA